MVLEVNIHELKILDSLDQPMRHKGIHGGRGSGKSLGVAQKIIIRSIDHYERILCGREFQSTIKDSVKHVIEERMHQMCVAHLFTITKTEIINNRNGSNFLFYGFRRDPHKIKSLNGVTLAWIEEAQTLSKESLELLIPTVRIDNSELWYTYNRELINEPVHNLITDSRRDNTMHVVVNYHDNPFFPAALRKEMEFDKQYDDGKYRNIWCGEPRVESQKLIFNGKWIRDSDVIPNEETIFYFGADWGFANDPTTLVRMWVDDKKREIYIDREAYGVGIEIDDIPELFESISDVKKWKITADSARPETISYIKRRGFKIEAARKGKGSVEEGVEFLKSYMIRIHPRCKHVIDEFGLYSYKTNKLTGEILPLIEDKNNHCIDSIRYGLEKLIFRHRNRVYIG